MINRIKPCNDRSKKYSFISYSHADADKVYPILEELHSNKYRFWYDHHIESGARWADYISEWLIDKNCAKFIIFVSKNSTESENVKDEVHLARKYRKSCLVVYLDDVELTGGLELQLDRWQSIKWNEETEEVAMKKLMKAIPTETIEMVSGVNEPESEFSKKYLLTEVIGKGGSSTVYKAKMKATDAWVTVKVSNGNTTILENEKDMLAKLSSPFIPKIIDYGKDYFNGEMCAYLVESFVEGVNLSEIRCPLSEEEVVMIILDVARTLRYLRVNDTCFVHTDIKPANIMVDRFNKIHLIDFGSCVKEDSLVRWGTKSFAPLEQRMGMTVDVRTDIYSLGITMKYLLAKDTLRMTGTTFGNVYDKKILSLVPHMNCILALIVDKMTEEYKENRFQSLAELIAVLEEFQKTQSGKPEMLLDKNEYYTNDMTVLMNADTEFDPDTNDDEDTIDFVAMQHSALLDLSVTMSEWLS